VLKINLYLLLLTTLISGCGGRSVAQTTTVRPPSMYEIAERNMLGCVNATKNPSDYVRCFDNFYADLMKEDNDNIYKIPSMKAATSFRALWVKIRDKTISEDEAKQQMMVIANTLQSEKQTALDAANQRLMLQGQINSQNSQRLYEQGMNLLNPPSPRVMTCNRQAGGPPGMVVCN